MIKVLMCGNHPSNKGGMTTVINQIKEHNWESEGIEVNFISTYMPGNLVKKILFFVIAYIRIFTELLFNKPDIVHMHMSYKGSFDRKYSIHKLCKKNHVPDIIHLHGSEFEKWYTTVSEKRKEKIRLLLSQARLVVVLGEEWKQVIKSIEPLSNVAVISNGIEIPNETVIWNEEQCNVLFLGVLIKRKGVADLLETVQDIYFEAESNLLGGVDDKLKMRFIIAGTGEEENSLRCLTKEKGIGNYIDFLGWISGEDKKNCLLNSQVMILPSYNEGLPISILEAMSYGMPVISTDVGDIPSVIKHRENGLLFSPGDTEALKECLLYLTKKENYSRLAKNAKKTIAKDYSLNHFIKKIRNMYYELCNT